MNNFHELLQKQIHTHLTVDCIKTPSFTNFFQAVNETYSNFEKEKKILRNTFNERKNEYELAYQKLKTELDQKKESIKNLDKSLQELDTSYEGIKNKGDNDDMFLISNYLKKKISKGKKIKKNFSRNIELLKTLLSNLQSSILVENENQKPIFTNQLYCNTFLLFYQPETVVNSGLSNLSEVSGDLFKNPVSFKNRIKKIIENRVIVTNELLETVDNRFLERDYIPIFINSEHKGHLWKYTDVTQRIKTQNLLEQSEIRSNLIMNSSLHSIINVNSHGKIIFWNSQAEIIFGWKKEDVLGKNLSKTIFSNQDIDFHVNAIEKYLETGDISALNKQIELSALNRFGEEFPIEIAVIPIKQGDEIFFCSFIQDISERKNSELSLKHQEEKYRNIIANVNLGLIEIDTNDIIRYVNHTFVLMSGYEIEELLGKKTTDFFDFGKDFDVMKSRVNVKNKTVSELFQFPITNKSGELRWWAISRALNFDDNGKLVGSIETHLDITNQKQLEIELENEKTKAENASIAKEAFLANMSHEIRTPLNAIIGFLRELQKREHTELQQKYLENSSIASKHLLAVINNILDISKIESGEMPIENRDFVFENSLKNVITVLKTKAEQKGLTLSTTISNKIHKVLIGDTLKIEQILFNLIGNALKFTHKGQVAIDCEVVFDDIFSQKLRISISDTGIGMDKIFLDSIFKKFSQEDKAITRKFGGTGLGMAITKELIVLLNGEIEVESEKNEGTTIHINLNLKKGDSKNLKNLQIGKKLIQIDNLSILLVEDNEMNRIVAQNSLSDFNCKVTEAENGMEALKILKKETFDVILMDIQMPDMDGIETTKIIRDKLKLTTPIIALTANAFKTEIDKCQNAGMNDYVTKPFDDLILIKTIARHTINKTKTASKTDNSVANQLYNLHSLHTMSRGNKDFVTRMVTIFVEQIVASLAIIDKAIIGNNFNELGRLMHKIKPSVENLAIVSIVPDIKYLEKATELNYNDKDQIIIVYSRVKKTLEEVIFQLQKNELNL
ncbi:PAS domain S-box protein [Flavobacterium sp. LB3P45]|uniref:histidine kinase n=1 Tax=Flavobacterium fructosi TaxID=3230416 RepID=A0ABW6HKA7_9FLAO